MAIGRVTKLERQPFTCVDHARASPEYKLLRLHECLQGEAFKIIENLGHAAAAYETAKARLERKYGGKRRALTLRLEELDAFKKTREGNEKDLEHFAELLDAVVVNLTDANQEAELGSGSLYITLQRKFNTNLVTKYKQWVCHKERALCAKEDPDPKKKHAKKCKVCKESYGLWTCENFKMTVGDRWNITKEQYGVLDSSVTDTEEKHVSGEGSAG